MCVFVCGFCRLLDILLDLHIGWARHFWKLLTRSNSILNGFFLVALCFGIPYVWHTKYTAHINFKRKTPQMIAKHWWTMSIRFHMCKYSLSFAHAAHCASFSIDTTLIRYYRWISMKFYITSIWCKHGIETNERTKKCPLNLFKFYPVGWEDFSPFLLYSNIEFHFDNGRANFHFSMRAYLLCQLIKYRKCIQPAIYEVKYEPKIVCFTYKEKKILQRKLRGQTTIYTNSWINGNVNRIYNMIRSSNTLRMIAIPLNIYVI